MKQRRKARQAAPGGNGPRGNGADRTVPGRTAPGHTALPDTAALTARLTELEERTAAVARRETDLLARMKKSPYPLATPPPPDAAERIRTLEILVRRL